MDALVVEFTEAHRTLNGYALAATITPSAPINNLNKLRDIVLSSNIQQINTEVRYATVYNNDLSLTKPEAQTWQGILVAYWTTALQIVDPTCGGGAIDQQWARVYEAWKDVVNGLIRGYNSGALPAWTVPCLYIAGRYLRVFAIKADKQSAGAKDSTAFDGGFQDDFVQSVSKNDKLEDAARQINRIFSICVGDRAPLEDSRKWAIYYIASLLFKTYFKLGSISLSKNILRSVQASTTDMPPLTSFPRSHIVTFEYYHGVILFLEEDYEKAEEHLTNAWRLCHRNAFKNRELILTYLIPCHLLTTHTLPSAALLEPFPRLQKLFLPLSGCIKSGDLAGFDTALADGQDEFVKRRIYLTLERGRDITMRNLFRKVFMAGGFEDTKEGGRVRRTRVPIWDFMAAVKLGLHQNPEEIVEREEVECFLANMIYKNLMKGYISREHAKVVLSRKGDAFPGTGV